MKKLGLLLGVPLLGVPLYLLVAPTKVDPRVWIPPPAPSLDSGPYAANEVLKGIERLERVSGRGPETVVPDGQGQLYTGFEDGRIVRFAADGTNPVQVANTGGRPLGLAVHPEGSLIVADALRGLLRVDPRGGVTVLTTEAEGQRLGFTDDVVVEASGKHAYFSDASSKWGWGHVHEDIIEHGGHGRLLRHDFDTGRTTVLLKGLHFANGVTLGPDEAYVLVNETGAYRVLRYWLQGEKAGTSDVFVDGLPGFPDNITFNGRDRFWVALFAPRDPLLDGAAGSVFVRKVFARLIPFIPAARSRHVMALAFDTRGHLVANLQADGRDTYSRLTCVREVGAWLYFGSLEEDRVGRMSLEAALAPEVAPP